ncbi:hypothetical protein QYE77_00725 [Thermanaerothrix sp. 4228-RoL]|uniref:Uncharacterized protein n=1 Tax=Thermanaerothrix solaris TaxID=3058434 RepID=A0ABU3NIT7_9CHLR|nr:hypothetical protein [Thermanaerothrix sp. 4228-RoL]MDT8896773.1 hypothetical protein [Thermanaerothrix sp. 4228-RoL]
MAGDYCPPLILLPAIELDRRQVERLHPLYRAFYRLDAVDQSVILDQVRRLQAAVPGLSEGDCLELLAKIGPYTEVTRPKTADDQNVL